MEILGSTAPSRGQGYRYRLCWRVDGPQARASGHKESACCAQTIRRMVNVRGHVLRGQVLHGEDRISPATPRNQNTGRSTQQRTIASKQAEDVRGRVWWLAGFMGFLLDLIFHAVASSFRMSACLATQSCTHQGSCYVYTRRRAMHTCAGGTSVAPRLTGC